MYSISWLTFFTETDSSRRGFDPTWTAVSAGYFDASGVRLLRGRDFPTSGGDHSVIVNEAMARTAWPGRPALGQCMRFGMRSEPCYRVIGVVENSREHAVIEEAKPMYYLPLNDLPPVAKGWTAGCVILNAEPAAAVSVVASIRALIRQEFPGGIPSIVRLNDYLDPQYRPWRLGATLFSVFGILALVVAVIGIYSTTSYGVEQRVHEFGIRIALGARMADVMRLVLVGGLRVVATGVLLGIALAIAAGRLDRVAPLRRHANRSGDGVGCDGLSWCSPASPPRRFRPGARDGRSRGDAQVGLILFADAPAEDHLHNTLIAGGGERVAVPEVELPLPDRSPG